MCCVSFSSIPGLYPPDANSTTFLPFMTAENVCRYCQMSPVEGGKLSPAEARGPQLFLLSRMSSSLPAHVLCPSILLIFWDEFFEAFPSPPSQGSFYSTQDTWTRVVPTVGENVSGYVVVTCMPAFPPAVNSLTTESSQGGSSRGSVSLKTHYCLEGAGLRKRV